MVPFKKFIQLENVAANCTGAAVVGTDASDPTSPAQPMLGQKKKPFKRKKVNAGNIQFRGS